MLRSGFLVAALVATSAAALTAVPAHADARVKVPFSFTVNGKVCPAGIYRVKSDRENNAVTLIGRDSAKTFSWVVVPTSASENPNRVVLQFDKSNHALRSIQYGAESTSRLDTQRHESDEDNDSARGGR
jgi:hypothetical protein